MMYDFEYENIISHWADEYEMNVSELERAILIESYKELTKIFNEPKMTFDEMIRSTLLDFKWEQKYPGLELYDRIHAYYNLN